MNAIGILTNNTSPFRMSSGSWSGSSELIDESALIPESAAFSVSVSDDYAQRTYELGVLDK